MPAHKPLAKLFVMSDEHRVKIQNSRILSRLIKHAEGGNKMSQTEVNVGLGLMKKVLPDLSAVTIGGDVNNPLTVVFNVSYQAPMKTIEHE